MVNVASLRRLALLLLLVPAPALAAWPHTTYLGNVPVCTATGNQLYPRMASDGAGGVIVTWIDQGSGHVFAQRVSAAGVPLWTTNGVVVCNAPGTQYYPDIVSDGAGGAILAWEDLRNGANYDIYAQRLNSAGVPQWTANGVVICNAANDQTLYYYGGNIVSDGAGGAVIGWTDARVGGTNPQDVYAQRVNAAGVVQWTANGVAICTATDYQYLASVASDGFGGFLFTWYDRRNGANNDIYAQRLNAAGVPLWAANGAVVCNAADYQDSPFILSDGTGGAIVAWRDYRNGGTTSYDLYIQRMTAAGSAAWIANGVPFCQAAGEQDLVGMISDGAGGVIIAFTDGRNGNWDVYAQRIVNGTPQWATDGVPICTASGSQFPGALCPDGAGGAIIVWGDQRGIDYDAYAQRVNASGSTMWAYNGVVISNSPGDQGAYLSEGHFAAVPDGAGGAILSWTDIRNGAGQDDIYAQRIERFGNLGNPEPSIASVRDVPLDQGGHIKVTWNASYLDADPFPIYSYNVYRSVPPNMAAAALASGARRITGDERIAPRPGERLFKIDAATGYAWEYVGNEGARGFAQYSFIVPTLGDSVGAGNPRTVVMIEAQGNGWWDSAPDSGYSVDNLPPAQPAPFAGQYFSGATHLHWGPNSEADLAGYRLYKGSSSGFVPGPGNLVSAQPDTGYTDVDAAGSWYKLSAVDAHGNESPFAVLSPSGTTNVGGGMPATLEFALASANPSHSGARFRLSLPRAAEVRVAVYDVAGREMMVLTRGARDAGVHELAWDGRDASGRPAADGMYVARLVAGGEVRATRFMMIK